MSFKTVPIRADISSGQLRRHVSSRMNEVSMGAITIPGRNWQRRARRRPRLPVLDPPTS